jgi:glycosyltransferase involved in cell wall biosynthesis
MHVTFVLPGPCRVPSGGPRMILRYASALADAGWPIKIVMVPGLRPRRGPRRWARLARYWFYRSTGGFKPNGWQPVHPAVDLQWWLDLSVHRTEPADVVVATSVQTAEAVAAWPRVAGRKFYFIQGYETWDFSQKRVEQSWQLPMQKIVVSKWLLELVRANGGEAELLPNALDHEAFGRDRPLDERETGIVFPWHPRPLKGAADVIEASSRLIRAVPDLHVRAYGVDRAPSVVDRSIVDYVRSPAPPVLRQLLNSVQVAVAPSHSEGWGLPACEALQCGCALVATEIGGHREFLQHEKNALLYPPGDVEQLVRSVQRLLGDRQLAERLAQQGIDDLQRLTLATSCQRLMGLLSRIDEA